MNASDLFNPYTAQDDLTQNHIAFTKWMNEQKEPWTKREQDLVGKLQYFYGNIDKKINNATDALKQWEHKYYELQNEQKNLKRLTDEYKNEKMLFETNPVVASQLRTERYNASEAAKARVWQQTMYGRRFQDAINDIKKAGLNPYILNNFSPAGGFTGGAAQIMSNVQHHFSNIKSTNYNRNKTTSKNWNYNKNEKTWNPMDIAQAILSGFAGIIGGAGSLIGGIGKMR